MAFVTWKKTNGSDAPLPELTRCVFVSAVLMPRDKQVTDISRRSSSWSNQGKVVSEFVPNGGQSVRRSLPGLFLIWERKQNKTTTPQNSEQDGDADRQEVSISVSARTLSRLWQQVNTLHWDTLQSWFHDVCWSASWCFYCFPWHSKTQIILSCKY